MPQTIVKTHPTDTDGNPVKFSDWCKANLDADEYNKIVLLDRDYMLELDAAGISWENDGYKVTVGPFPTTETEFWQSTAERQAIWEKLDVYLQQYKADGNLTWS